MISVKLQRATSQLLKTNMVTLSDMLQDELKQPADAFTVREE